ncbi:MAG: glycosyltransferase family 2 protein [Candidatus Limimorpha sp.]
MKISAVIITCNEELNIRRCLDSIKDVVDEVVVVDSLSSDATELICKEFGVVFISQKWLGYSAQKNIGIDAASNDWILSIDADEELSPELRKSILDLKKEDVGDDKVFSVKILPNYCGHWIRHCGWYPCPKRRIWNRKSGRWSGLIHEYVMFSCDVENVLLDGDLYHYSYHSVSQHVMKADKYSSLSAENAFNNGKRCRSGFKVFIKGSWTFFRDFIVKAGFLDGYYGFVVCRMNAFGTFLKYSKLYDMTQRKKSN